MHLCLVKLNKFYSFIEMRENTDQNNSEYKHFLRSVMYSPGEKDLVFFLMSKARQKKII